jgi:hypothetical protein
MPTVEIVHIEPAGVYDINISHITECPKRNAMIASRIMMEHPSKIILIISPNNKQLELLEEMIEGMNNIIFTTDSMARRTFLLGVDVVVLAGPVGPNLTASMYRPLVIDFIDDIYPFNAHCDARNARYIEHGYILTLSTGLPPLLAVRSRAAG